MIKIVTDTTCDLPPDWFSRYNITAVPINIQFGLETFKDRVTIDPDTFYQRINTEGELPTTSQPSVGEFAQVYQDLAADGSQILSIHLTSKLSGTWQAAILTAKQQRDKIKINVVDSLTGSVGLGLMVREAAQLVEPPLASLERAGSGSRADALFRSPSAPGSSRLQHLLSGAGTGFLWLEPAIASQDYLSTQPQPDQSLPGRGDRSLIRGDQ